MIELRPFQRAFIRAATAPGIDTAALSIPRGNGKSALAGHILTRVMDPTDELFRPGTESVLCAASIEQARIVHRFARADLEDRGGGYRFLDSHTRIGITHTATNTRIRVIGSNGRTAMGLVGCPWAVCDEPGAWETNGGQLLHDAIETAKGKPGSPLRALYIGTLAPAMGGWWHEMIEAGSARSAYVQHLRGDPARWDNWHEIRRCNPLVEVSATFRRKLLEERDAARRDSRLKARFMSYRLNLPSADEATMRLCCKLGEGAMRDQGASCSPYDSALARRSCSHAMASVRAHGPRPKARSTIRASPTMPPWRANIPAWPLRSARITSKPLIVA